MEKIILVDGNNLFFRSYYATAYNGNFMKNSKNFPTNALYGFVNMINRIIEDEKPTYIMVAFDKGKTFRHEKFDFYKQGRIETPNELKIQFPIAKQILTAMGIKYYDIDNYEADDIIGTFAKYCDEDPNFIGTIISSDRDLLQLITNDIEIKLLRMKDYIRYNETTFKEEYGIDPINIIDLKALMGDSSDNIPGVKGVGEKTALKLLQEYKTLDQVYENIEKINGKLKEKLVNEKDKAYMSYEIATIYKEVPLNFDIEDTRYNGIKEELNEIYESLEFYSFIKKNKQTVKQNIDVKIINEIEEIVVDRECAIYLEMRESNYHNANVLGMAVYNEDVSYYIPLEILCKQPDFLINCPKITYDLKKVYVALKWKKIKYENTNFDTMIAASLLDYTLKDDIAYLAQNLGYCIPFHEEIYGKTNKEKEIDINEIAQIAISKAKFIFETKKHFLDKIKENDMLAIYEDIEIPLSTVLGDMEYEGVHIDKEVLKQMGTTIKIKLEEISKKIYELAGENFNISSPSQLGAILFEKLQLAHFKKGKTGYSTDNGVLTKLLNKHPIIPYVIEYRTLSKLYTTYIEGLLNVCIEDKIHTIYTQVLTRTGRLSSIEPNLQNIPIRYEVGKLIRKAFVPSDDSIIMTSDYSQIELRILASMANIDSLIEAFNNDLDIHIKTASDIFHVDIDSVTKQMRTIAKAVNFGIIYGISSFGLSANLNISNGEAKRFIDDYLNTYSGIKEYMDNTIKDAHDLGYTRTLFNRKRNIEELKNSNYMIRQSGERMALNTPIQGTSADIIKKAMVEIHKRFKIENLQSKLIIQVHDELVIDTRKEEEEKVHNILKEVMENICKLKVKLQVEIEKGENWYEAK